MKLDTPYAVEQAARVYNGATPPSAANGSRLRDYLDISERHGK
jgi:hypothetical protein